MTSLRETNSASAPPLLDVVGLADRLGVTERFVRRLVAERRVPFVKLCKFIRFYPRDIESWLEEARVPEL